jgi:hypothetical protein
MVELGQLAHSKLRNQDVPNNTEMGMWVRHTPKVLINKETRRGCQHGGQINCLPRFDL